MPAPKGNRFAVGNKGGGRHSQFNPKFTRRAELAGRAGFTDTELAELFDVSLSAVEKWKRQREDFRNALKIGKAEADGRLPDEAVAWAALCPNCYPPYALAKRALQATTMAAIGAAAQLDRDWLSRGMSDTPTRARAALP
jgi:hypothetical protein